MNRDGSSDSYAYWCQPRGTRTRHLALLRERLEHWKPSVCRPAFDDAVRLLLQAAVDEWADVPDEEFDGEPDAT